MKILRQRKLEDCFDGSTVYGYEFTDPWDEARIQALARFGKLDYFTDFPRPMFRVTCESGLFIQGLAGTNQCRVILPRTDRGQAVRHFEDAMSMLDRADAHQDTKHNHP